MASHRVRLVHDEAGTFSQVDRPEHVHVIHGEVGSGIRSPGPLLIAAGARVMGDIDARGAVHLARGASVGGHVHAMGAVIVGAGASVAGGVRAEGRVVVQAGAIVSGQIDAAGDVQLMPGARVEKLIVGGDLHVRQPVRAPKVMVRGSVTIEPTSTRSAPPIG